MVTGKQRISLLAMALAMTLAVSAPVDASAVTFPAFTGVKVTPPQDVIAANLDEITPQNTVTVVHTIPQVVPGNVNMPNPSSAAVGIVTAFKNPNMSQQVPDCAPPPAPASNCNNIGQCGSPGSVSWSGWDKVNGGVCNGGSAGGWLVSAAGAAPANYYPPSPSPSLVLPGGGTTYVTPYGNTIYSNGTVVLANGTTVQGTINPNGTLSFGGQSGNVTTDSFTSNGYSTNNSNGNEATVAQGTLYANNANTAAGATQQGNTGAYTQKVVTSSSAVQNAANTIGTANVYSGVATNAWQ